MLRTYHKKLLLTVVTTVTSPVVFATDWTGGFIGLSAESNKMDTRLDRTTTELPLGYFLFNDAPVLLGPPVSSYSKDYFSDRDTDAGFIIGYDWQVNNWVMGVELDLSNSKNEQTEYTVFVNNISAPESSVPIYTGPTYPGSTYPDSTPNNGDSLLDALDGVDLQGVFGLNNTAGTQVPPGTAFIFPETTSSSNLGISGGLPVPLEFFTPSGSEGTTVPVSVVTATRLETKNTYSLRFRTGYLVSDNVLIYGVVGLATQDVSVKTQCFSSTASCNSAFVPQYQSSSKSMHGLLLGVGTEVMFNDHWSVRFEYNQVDYGDFSYKTVSYPTRTGTADPSNPVDVQVEANFNSIKTSDTRLDVKSNNAEFTVVYKF